MALVTAGGVMATAAHNRRSWNGWWAAHRKRGAQRRALAQLLAMDDARLDDLGLDRGDLTARFSALNGPLQRTLGL